MNRPAILAALCLGLATALGAPASETPPRLPGDVPPVVAAWFWLEAEFETEGYRPFLDLIAKHSGVNLLATSLRIQDKEVTDEDVRAQIAAAAEYAKSLGIGMAMDLDLRLARQAYRKAHPDEMQEMLRLCEVALEDKGEVAFSIASDDLSDHYTHRTTHYIPLAGRLVRVYDYERGSEGIVPSTVRDITASHCTIDSATAQNVSVRIACRADTEGRTACVMAAFSHLTPAVFAPHLLDFQGDIIAAYRDTALAGVCKDEWGFPPCFDGCPQKNDYWFSRFRAAAYVGGMGGVDLVRDCLLMTYGEAGREAQRQAAINRFMAMSTKRNALIEDDFYRATKGVFGPDAVVATHPTWYPYPGLREFKKNGLDWWQAPRDFAQVDEVTPYCVRSSLAKKWDSPVWYNMFYDTAKRPYEIELWAGALTGGRIDYHPIYPRPKDWPFSRGYEALLEGGLMRGDSRVCLLNFITSAPLDCPVAVVFGHACAMNWAGPAYDDVGIAFTNALWEAGYPADLIPSSEIHNDSLRVGTDASAQYGPQRYQAVVLYHPQFEPRETAAFFRELANGPTKLFHTGLWNRGFEAKDFDGIAALPEEMAALDSPEDLIAALKASGIARQEYTTRTLDRFNRQSVAPGASGATRLTDGTHIIVAGEDDPAGDPIARTITVDKVPFEVDAVGLVAIRLDAEGTIDGLAAGGLKRFSGAGWDLALPERLDVAIWHGEDGTLRGVCQAAAPRVPAPLLALTEDWQLLRLPEPL